MLLEKNRDRLLKENYLALDEDGSELWRISVRLGALNDVDYGQFVTQLRRVVEPVLGAYELRDEILHSVADRRVQDGQIAADAHDPWLNSRIAVLGLPDPRATDTNPTEATVNMPMCKTTAETSDDLAEQSDKDLGVDVVFAKVLGDLLRAKKFMSGRGGKKHLLWWNDPVANPPGSIAEDKWAKTLQQFDCVVVLADHPDYDMDFIREHAKHVVDAREHGFVAGAEETAKKQGKPIQVTYTGVVPIVYKAQRTLLHSLIDSIGWAFVMIAAVMMILLRTKKRQLLNIRGGLVSMIPNVFPVIIVFGAIGYMSRWDVVVDIGTMMTASVAMGVAVDDTIHFLTWFRRGIRMGMDRADAIKEAYSHVAVAMTQTTIIGGLGLSVFALSTFTPTQRFGTMMLTLLVAALFGDLILLPALLAGPLGKYLCPKVTGPSQSKLPVEIDDSETPVAETPAVLSMEKSAPVKGPSLNPNRDSRSSRPCDVMARIE